MKNRKHAGKDWSKDPKGAYEFVFESHRWGNPLNAGKAYKRNVKGEKVRRNA